MTQACFVTFLNEQDEGFVTSAEKLEIAYGSLVPLTVDAGKMEITACSLALP